MSGALRFCRYAHPPNALGFCGPADAGALFEHAAAAGSEVALLARAFDGAWPYLELIAAANGIADPLDERVVEAYWVGNELLGSVDQVTLGRHVEERFRPRMGRRWAALTETRHDASAPHHNFHVFVVYPWVGMLRMGRTSEPLRVLDRCRVRWGTVQAVEGDSVLVVSRLVRYDGATLSLGEPEAELVAAAAGGLAPAEAPSPGDIVSMHWDWMCERLRAREVAMLERHTARALAVANDVLRRPAGSVLA